MARALGGLILAVFLCIVWVRPAHATDTYDQAMAKCEDYRAAYRNPPYHLGECRFEVVNSLNQIAVHVLDSNNVDKGLALAWLFSGDPPNQCLSRPSYPMPFNPDNGINVCRGGCQYGPVTEGEDGPVKHCVRGIDGSMHCSAYGRMKPTGEQCEGGPGPTDPPPPPPPPRVCGGGSCFDAGAGQYCAVNGAGVQVCVPAPKPGQPGACVSGGDTTLCTGNPPPAPPPDKVPDPPTDIRASDRSTDQPIGPSGPTGPIINNTTNNYGSGGGNAPAGGNAPNPGTGTGDIDGSGKPPAGGTDPDPSKDDGTSASGGGDCNTPPIVEGSAALAMIARQQWLTRCKGGEGEGSDPDDSDKSVPGLDGISENGDGLVRQGGNIFDKLDFSGLAGGGGGTCPPPFELHLASYGVDYDTSPEGWCDMLHAVGVILEWFAVVGALVILGGR